MKIDFDEWFDIFREELRRLGWHGPVDRDSARCDYDSNIDPYKAARSLYEELK